ncbi:hypothetical protein M9458_036570 [Cirrhinus mrigala]|uniref:Uncharacterized protein n=1 Tax=Cirrhinus mrigala TaxID=683832 RepID=A0ABD0P5V5_CIRMR
MCPYMVVPVPVFIESPSPQGDRSLEDHTTDFVFLSNLTRYPDSCLCSFYHTGLNTTTRAQLLAAYVEWVLVSCQSSLAVDFVDDDISPTPDPVPSPTSFRSAERQPKPTADEEPKPSPIDEPLPRGATELRVTPEPEPITSNQVGEPASSHAREEFTVEHEDAKEGPAHCSSTEGEQILELGQMNLIIFEDIYADMPPLIPPLSELLVCPEPSVCPDLSACLPGFLSHSPSLASSTHPCLSHATSPTICAVGSPRVCQFPSALWLDDPSSPPPASESWTPPRPSKPAVPPRLLALSSPPLPIGSPAPPGSLVPPAPPWLVVDPPSPQDSTPPGAPCRSVPPAPLGSSLPPALPQSSVAPAPLRTSGSPLLLWSPEPWTLPWPSGSLVLPGLVGSPSLPWAPPPLAPPRQPYFHHGSSFRRGPSHP